MKFFNFKFIFFIVSIIFFSEIYIFNSKKIDENLNRIESIKSENKVSENPNSSGFQSEIFEREKENLIKTSEIAKDFYASTNLRAFSERAKKHPNEGGISYALKAVDICARVKNIPDIILKDQTDSVVYGKKLSALNNLRYRCQEFSSKEIGTEGMSELYKLRKEKSDLLASNEKKFQEILGSAGPSRNIKNDERIKFLNDLFNLGDSEAIGSLGPEMLTYSNSNGKLGFWINGKPYFSEEQINLVNHAWDWSSCMIGRDCKKNSIVLEMHCIEEGLCFDSIDDYYRLGVYAGNSNGFSDLIYVRDETIKLIRHKDFESFLNK